MRKRSIVAGDSCAVRSVHPGEVAAVRARLAGNAEIERATALFALLADPTRARILHALSLVPRLCVCDVAASLGMSESAVSHQLRLLRASHLVSRVREGRIAYYSLADEHVRHVLDDALQHASEDNSRGVGVPA
jgi:ArsR family transcriptional regulator, lead/cadmium/zinc/bismuth-responsive transcriptional repressor